MGHNGTVPSNHNKKSQASAALITNRLTQLLLESVKAKHGK